MDEEVGCYLILFIDIFKMCIDIYYTKYIGHIFYLRYIKM